MENYITLTGRISSDFSVPFEFASNPQVPWNGICHVHLKQCGISITKSWFRRSSLYYYGTVCGVVDLVFLALVLPSRN
jgi:hypothetical protein